MDVENIDALNAAELDALLERALDPQVPVEVFYAVLERIGQHEQAATGTAGDAAAKPAATALVPLRASIQPSSAASAAPNGAVAVAYAAPVQGSVSPVDGSPATGQPTQATSVTQVTHMTQVMKAVPVEATQLLRPVPADSAVAVAKPTAKSAPTALPSGPGGPALPPLTDADADATTLLPALPEAAPPPPATFEPPSPGISGADAALPRFPMSTAQAFTDDRPGTGPDNAAPPA